MKIKPILTALFALTVAQSAFAEKILVAYFSHPEQQGVPNKSGVDALSGASILEKNNQRFGSTEFVAKHIQSKLGADLFRIETVQSYPFTHDPLLDQAQKEKRQKARPQLKAKIDNLNDYDTVFIGYPIWWYEYPMAMYSFLDSHDFSGKKVVPFITHGGSRFLHTVSELQKRQPNAKVESNGLALYWTDLPTAESQADSWLKQIGY